MKIVCQVCGIEGYLQHIGKNYYRVRHYQDKAEYEKSKFYCHQQPPAYVRILVSYNESGSAGVKSTC